MKNLNKKLADKDFYKVIISLIIFLLTLITFTSMTAIGAFFTYIFAYLFGYFYYIVLLVIAVLSLRMMISKKFFPFKKYLSFYLGLIIIFIASLCFASFNLIVKDPSFNFSKLSYTYNDLMTSFARHPNKIDSFNSLSSLGGGYIGAFFIALFGSIWKGVGDAIFFSFVLLFGIFLLLYKPLRYLINEMKANKKKKVTYSPITNKPVEKKEFSKNLNDLSSWDNENNDTPFIQGNLKSTTSFTPITSQLSNEEIKSIDDNAKQSSQDNESQNDRRNDESIDDNFYSQSSFKTSEYFIPKNTTSTIEEKHDEIQATNDEPSVKVLESKKEDLSLDNLAEELSSYDDKVDFSSSTKEIETESLNNIQEEKIYSPINNDNNTIENKSFTNNYQTSTYSFHDDDDDENEVIENTESYNPSFNPLAEAAKRASKSTNNNSITINMIDDGEDDEEDTILSEEEQQELIVSNYRKSKREEQIRLLKEKEAEKQRELDAVMKYVSPTEKKYSYSLPNDTLLDDIDDSNKIEENRIAANEKCQVINQVFDNFKINAKVQSLTIGSSVTRFNIALEKGVQSSKLTKITPELQRALKGDKSVRIETVVEGQDMPSIEIGNAKPMAVSFKEAFTVIEQNTEDNLLIPIGKDIAGNIVTDKLDKMPHLLVAGTTGSGKSVLVHSIIMTLLMRNYPNQLKLMLIDPKQVEFTRYTMEPHLFCPIITDAKQAVIALSKLCDEMERRYSILAKNGCNNMISYRAKQASGKYPELNDIPNVVCIIDEFADLMQTSDNLVADSVQRITQKARAAGIYLIVATQRPEKNVLPGIIKSNIPCRIALSCSSNVDSRVILDEIGAETLLGRGDLLFKGTTSRNLIRAQSPFISDDDIDRVLNYLKEKAGAPNYSPDFLDLKSEIEETENSVGGNTSDDKYEDIKDLVINTRICTKSILMKNFGLSYNNVNKVLARLQDDNIIEMVGNKYEVIY